MTRTTVTLTPSSLARVKAWIDDFVRGEYLANWTSQTTDEGGYSRDPDKRDRYNRCHAAAEQGADGMTHAEHIEDMRDAFREYMRSGRKDARGRRHWESCERFETAVHAHFDALEAWHEKNGSLHEEVG